MNTKKKTQKKKKHKKWRQALKTKMEDKYFNEKKD